MIDFENKYSGDQITVSYGGVKQTFEEFFKQDSQQEKRIIFMKSQLDLYATLCQNRNYSSSKSIAKIFTITSLIRYIENDEIPDDIRAVLIKIVSVIHIDREPRTVQERPSLVKIINVDKDSSESKPPAYEKYKTVKAAIESGNEIEMTNILHPNKDEAEPILGKTEDHLEKEVLDRIKTFIFNHLQRMSDLCAKQEPAHVIYNQLTYEIIKTVCLMLKFGLFKTKNAKESSAAFMGLGAFMKTATSNKKKVSNNLFSGKSSALSEVEKLIKYLTPILEYDEAYFKAMNILKVKRKWLEQSTSGNNGLLNNVFTGFTGIGKSFVSIINDEDPSKKKSKSSALNAERESELIKDQIFKKSETLKKVLNKFSNKTFIIKEEEGEGFYEVDIKISICQTYELIFDMREEFILENFVEYFRTIFLNKTISMKQDDQKNIDLTQELATLLPDSYREVAGSIDNSSKFKNYTAFQEIKSCDVVLGRPLIESVLLSFFFTQSAPLQNAILGVLQRMCSEKYRIKDSIEKLEPLFSDEHKQLYTTMQENLDTLKNLTSNAQIWLQIIDSNPYQPDYFKTLERYIAKLADLENIFQQDFSNDEALKIVQRIFRYLGGPKIIYEMFQKGIIIFDSYIDYFRRVDIHNFSLRAQIADKIVALFRKCHNLLGLFCHKNPHYQKFLFEKYLNSIMRTSKIDLGQIELISEILKNNIDLANRITERQLKFFLELMDKHGKKEAFLKVFDEIVNITNKDTIDIQKKILVVLLNEQYIDKIRPTFRVKKVETLINRNGFPIDKNPMVYTSKLLGVISKCLRGDIGVGFITKVLKILKISDLFEFLKERTLLRSDSQEIVQQEEVISELEGNTKPEDALANNPAVRSKYSAVEILNKFCKTSIHFLEEFTECSKIFFEYIAEELRNFENNSKDPAFVQYLLEQLLPFLNEIYSKEPSMIEITDIKPSPENQLKQKVYRFASQSIAKFENFRDALALNLNHLKEIEQLGRHFKMAIPENVNYMIKKIEAELNREQEVTEAESKTKTKEKKKKSKTLRSSMTQKPEQTLMLFKEESSKQAYIAWRLFRT